MDPRKLVQGFTHPTPPANARKNSRPYITDSELSLALFEHVESATLEPEACHLSVSPKQRTPTVSLPCMKGEDVVQEYHRASVEVPTRIGAAT